MSSESLTYSPFDMDEIVGKKIRELREKSGLSQFDLGTLINCTQRKVSFMETGSRTIKVSDLRRISNALGIEMYTLVTFDD